MSHVLHVFIHIGNLHTCILPNFLHGGMSIMCDLHCSCDANLGFFCVGTFSDSYHWCFAALLANASARFILWFQRNWKDRTYCSSRAASLVPNPSRVLNSLGTYFFRWRHTWSSNCVQPPNPMSNVACTSDATSNQRQHAPPHPTPPNPMSNVACTSDATSNQRQHAPPHPTPPNPYVQRSVHIRCNFKPTSTCPTPPHPTQPYVQRSGHIRCNFKPTSTCPTHTPPRPLSTHVGRSKNRYNKPPSPAKVQPSVVEPKLPLWDSDLAKARVDNSAMGSLTEALATTSTKLLSTIFGKWSYTVNIFLWECFSSSGLFIHCTSGCFRSLNRLGHSSWVLAWSRCLNPEGAGLEQRKDVLRGQTLDLKLARLLREACADLGWNILIFGRSVFFHVFSIKLQIETPGGLEPRNCMRQPMLQIQIRCRITTKNYENFFKETTWEIPL